jgi:putative ABC transport system permease protein
MLSNYLKLALRNLVKYRFYSLINISGLTVGILCFLCIFLYVRDELSYDNYHAAGDRLFRLNFYGKLGDQTAHTANSPAPCGPTFKQSFPETEEMCRLREVGSFAVRFDNQLFTETDILFADSTLFRVFSFPLKVGNPETALREPKSVVVSETVARKYFGAQDPLGKALQFDNKEFYKVTGVMADLPRNTHFQADFFISMSSLEESREDNWGSTNFATYFTLRPGSDEAAWSRKANDLFVQRFSVVLKQFLSTTWEEFTKSGNYARVELFPVQKIHLYSDLDDELAANGDIKYVWIFSIVGLLILALACINFMNLATARASIRSKEVGVRKTVGAGRGDLQRQFLTVSLLLSLFAWALALVGLWATLPLFNDLSGKAFVASDLFRADFLLFSFGFAVAVGLAAGSYPAFFLSSLRPVFALKGGTSGAASKSTLRSGLVVFQFFTTTVLLLCALTVWRQLDYIHHKRLGFNKDQVLVLHDANLLDDKMEAFKTRLLQNPAIKSATASNFLPVSSDRNTTSVVKGRTASPENTILVNNWWVDYHYLQTMGIEIAEGRDFSSEMSTDSSAVLVNETLARSLGWPQTPAVGQEIGFPRENGHIELHHIIGVVKNFHFTSLRDNIEPLAIFFGGDPGFLSFRLETKEIAPVIEQMETVWQEMTLGQPFTYSFLDERFGRMYDAETRIGKITGIFAVLAIFIACLGLFGLATFATQQRTKEIGIRKVLGASVTGITSLLAGDFLKLVIVAFVIAAPVAYFFMQKWLSDFAYRIDIQWWMFALAGFAAIAIAFLTVGFQSVRAALANPVKSLRSE